MAVNDDPEDEVANPRPDVELLLRFNGIDVPTIETLGKECCALKVNPLVDGREVESNHIILAYPSGSDWKATLIRSTPGQYRLTLISPQYHCTHDFVLDDATFTTGVLQVEFDRSRCRRKLVPLFLYRLWLELLAWRDKWREHPRNDARCAAQYRKRFRNGPIGTWLSDPEVWTLYGWSVEFRRDFTGRICSWDTSEDTETEREFRWRVLGDFSLDVQPVDGVLDPGMWGRLDYDFRVTRNAYGRRQIELISKPHPEPFPDRPSFWWSANPMTLSE